MANEVTEIEGYGALEDGQPRRFEVASGTKIAKGTVLKLTNNRTAIKASGTADVFAGIAAADKSATDLSTSIAAWENGIYEFTASGSITAGDAVRTSAIGENKVGTAGDLSTATNKIVGYALKSATNDDRVQVRVNN